MDRWFRPENWPQLEELRDEPRPTRRSELKSTCEYSGAEIAGETAASLAAASIQNITQNYGCTLNNCIDLQNECRGERIPGQFLSYNFRSSGDELAWTAAWLLRATGEQHYLSDAEKYIKESGLNRKSSVFEIGDRDRGVQVLMAKITGEEKHRNHTENFCNRFVREAADIGINSQEYFNFTTRQIGYMLGDTGRSYVVGVGQTYPQRPRDRASSCPARSGTCDWPAYNNPHPNPHLLVGALVSGPLVHFFGY